MLVAVSVVSVCGRWRERRFDGFVIVLQRRLVASENDFVLGAGIKPALNALGYREILIFDSGHQQIEIIVPMPSGTVGQSRLGRVERSIHPRFVDPVVRRENVPRFEMIVDHNQDRVREQ